MERRDWLVPTVAELPHVAGRCFCCGLDYEAGETRWMPEWYEPGRDPGDAIEAELFAPPRARPRR